jgi:hypothetical protein
MAVTCAVSGVMMPEFYSKERIYLFSPESFSPVSLLLAL